MKLWCCGCKAEVEPRLTKGLEIYPHRPDLHGLPFWRCKACGNYVGCHHKTKEPTRPLGCIPTREILGVRKRIHATLDPLWKSGKFRRRELYAKISAKLGYEYHTGELRSVEEGTKVLVILHSLTNQGQEVLT